MNTFSNIRELIAALNKEQKLLIEMFKKRKELSYKFEMALELLEYDENRIEYLLSRSVIRKNGNYLEINDTFLEFFENVLEVNEEINTSYINENIENVQQNIIYYFNEPNESRKYNYLKKIKNILRKLGTITLRNVVDLKRNIDTTFKNEPNYKNKKTKLEFLDKKRQDITKLIDQTGKLITEDEETFFKTATDEELSRILIQLKVQLSKCTHNLIELEKQIMEFLNQIKYQSNVIEKLRMIKYLKDQFILQTTTDIDSVLAANKSVIFEPNPVYPLRLSLEYLQADEDAYANIVKIAKRVNAGVSLQRPIAEKISSEYLDTQPEEEIQINLEEVKNGFVASGYDLFDFVMSYDFAKDVSFDERVTVYCQLVSQFETILNITDKCESKEDIEFAMVYPK